VSLLLQDLVQSCLRGGGNIEGHVLTSRRRADGARSTEKKCVCFITAGVLQYLLLLLLFSSVQKFQIRHHAHGVGDEVGEGLGFEKGCFIIEM